MTRWLSGLGRQALGLPISTLMLIFFALPMLMVLSLAVRPYSAASLVGSGFTLGNFARFLGDATHLATFARTFAISAATTLLCMVLGYPVAWHLHRLRSGTARLWLTLLVLMPLMVSLVVASFAWVLILGNNGALNVALVQLGLVAEPIRLMNTATGVIIVAVFSHISYTILTTFAALENIDPGLARAARIHGASEGQVFARVILPLSLPGMVAGGLIVFALNMAAFVIPFLIGGGRVTVVPLLIYQFTMQLFDWPGAAAMGTLLFALTLGVTWAAAAAAQRAMPWERSR
jgi:putative spermidine/putrescine transport system permease protein